jgi:hypothetical protein
MLSPLHAVSRTKPTCSSKPSRVAEDETKERTTGACGVHHSSKRPGPNRVIAVVQPDDSADVESLTILRTPKYEVILEEWERGAKVSFERDLEGDETVLLREVFYAPDDKSVTLSTDAGPISWMFGKLIRANCLPCVACFKR